MRSQGFRRAPSPLWARAAACAAALALAACGGPAFDLAALERSHPALAAVDGQRLQDVTPYAWPRRDEILWFLCRWDGSRPLRTALPPDATERERVLLRRALASWESVGLGLHFEPTADPAGAQIAIGIGKAATRLAASTVAVCAAELHDGRLEARLIHARITLHRAATDSLGREVELSEAEWLGAALHELGHALGFQGHARRGPGIMVRDVEQVRRIGRDVLAGRALAAPSLLALYRLPSGTLLARVPLAPGRTRSLDRLAEMASARGYRGPLLRVGDTSARIDWSDPQGRAVGVRLPAIREVLRHPDRLEIVPGLVASAWLGEPWRP